jgi:hypothetical protein
LPGAAEPKEKKNLLTPIALKDPKKIEFKKFLAAHGT